MNVTIRTAEALALLITNKQKHVEEYTLQVQGWKLAMDEWSKKISEWQKSTPENIYDVSKEATKRPTEPTKPMSFIGDYDKYIDLLTHHAEHAVILNECEFEKIMKNEFSWKSLFVANSMTYNG